MGRNGGNRVTESDTIRVLSRTRTEWITYTFGWAIGATIVGTILGIIGYAVLNGLTNLGFGGAVPGLSTVGLFAVAVGGLAAGIAGFVLRPRRISVRGRASTGGTAGPNGSRYWRDHFAPDGAADGASGGAGEAAVIEP